MSDLAAVRRRYAEKVCRRAGVDSPALLSAFATVPREHYLGPGPWQIFDPTVSAATGSPYRLTPDADPAHLYEDRLVAIDASRLLNNGHPSSHALWIAALDPRPGDHLVHLGSGTGYFTAIMADMVGPTGRVTALEISSDLAPRARQNLSALPSVTVVEASGCTYDFGLADAIYVNAGATHPLPLWLDRLNPRGRLVFALIRWPMNPHEANVCGNGVMMRMTRLDNGDVARVLSLVGIFPCLGALDTEADRRLAAAFGRGVEAGQEFRFRREAHAPEPACWLHGEGYCLAMEER